MSSEFFEIGNFVCDRKGNELKHITASQLFIKLPQNVQHQYEHNLIKSESAGDICRKVFPPASGQNNLLSGRPNQSLYH